MPQPDLVELAKQGNVDAISSLIHYDLYLKGIIAKVKLNDGCLQVIMESSQVPEEQASVDFIIKMMLNLKITSIKTVKIYGRKTGDKLPAWSQELENKDISNNFELENNNLQLSDSRIKDIPKNISHFNTQVPSQTSYLKTNQGDWQKTVIMGSLIVGGVIGAFVIVCFSLIRFPLLSPASPFVSKPSLVPSLNPQIQVLEPAIQNKDISGKWVGILSQSIGNTVIKYKYNMFLSQNEQDVEGNTKIEMVENPQTYGVIQVRGTTSGKLFRFEDVGVVETNTPGFTWCIKTGSLQYTFSGGIESLSGAWKGLGACPSGEIYLEKQAN